VKRNDHPGNSRIGNENLEEVLGGVQPEIAEW